jgi:CheY-like chemotaxis protein
MKKILLVEDDPFIRDITSIKLSEHGYSVDTAENGAEAIAKLKSDVPSAVLLDLDLPDIKGFEVLKEMKADEHLKNVPVIIFSNNDDSVTMKQAEDGGASGFFVKATTAFEDLYQKLETLIKD